MAPVPGENQMAPLCTRLKILRISLALKCINKNVKFKEYSILSQGGNMGKWVEKYKKWEVYIRG